MWGLSYASFVSTMATNQRVTLAVHRYDQCLAGALGDPTQTCYSGIGSNHPGGTNIAMGDGAVKFQSETIDLGVWCTLGAMADGDKVAAPLP